MNASLPEMKRVEMPNLAPRRAASWPVLAVYALVPSLILNLIFIASAYMASKAQPDAMAGGSNSIGREAASSYLAVVMLAALVGLLGYAAGLIIARFRERPSLRFIFPVTGVIGGFVFAVFMGWLMLQGPSATLAPRPADGGASIGSASASDAGSATSAPAGANPAGMNSDSGTQWADAHFATESAGTPAIPTRFQGVWSAECATVMNGTTPGMYSVFGEDYIVSPPFDGLPATTEKVIDYVETKDEFAISRDEDSDSDEYETSPDIEISVYRKLADGGILLAAEFHDPDSFNPNQEGNKPERKCPSNPIFALDISAAAKGGFPTADEIAASNLAFGNMPPVDGVKWTP